MPQYLTYFLPDPENFIGLAAVLAVALAFMVIGAAVTGRNRLAPADVVTGWGVVLLVVTPLGVFLTVPFTYAFAGLAIVALGLLVMRLRTGERILPSGAAKVLALASVLLLIVTGMSPSQWDEYSHWLPAARYLIDIDAFPRSNGPPIMADIPAYPYAVPFVTYAVSRLAGGLIENAGPLFNVLLLLSFGLAALHLYRKARGDQDLTPTSWGWAALAVLFATTFNTTFVQKIILTAYADLPSAAALGFAAITGWFMIESLADDDREKARTYAWQMGLALTVFINAKQANLAIPVILVVGITLVALRDPAVRFTEFLRLVPLFAGPPAFIHLVWQYHVGLHLTKGGFTVKALADWNWSFLPQILKTIASIMFKKAAYFGLMGVIIYFGVRSLFRFRGTLDRLSIMTATVFGGYNAFLLFAYLAVFGGYTAANALSYWRYNLHLGLVGVAFTAYGAGLLWVRYGDRFKPAVISALPKIAVVLVLVLPAVFAYKLRFDVRAPKIDVRNVGKEVATMIPKGSRMVVLDPLDAGFYAKQMRYRLYGVASLVGVSNVFANNKASDLRKLIRVTKPSHIWVHTLNPAIGEVLKVSLVERHSHLLERDGDGWRLMKSWSYNGYNQPSDVPD